MAKDKKNDVIADVETDNIDNDPTEVLQEKPSKTKEPRRRRKIGDKADRIKATEGEELPEEIAIFEDKDAVSQQLLRKVSKDTSYAKRDDIVRTVFMEAMSFFSLLLLSVAIAICIWAYVFNIDSTEYQKSFHVPVEIKYLEGLENKEGLTVYSSTQYYVDIVISGKRSDVYEINNDNISDYVSLYVDATKIIGAGNTVLNVEAEKKNDDLILSFDSVSPKTFAIFADYSEEKTFEIKNEINYQLNSPLYEQYTANTELDVYEITLTGPKTVLDSISHAAVSLDLGSISESRNVNNVPITYIGFSGKAIESAHVTADVQTVDVKLMVETERSIPIEIICDDNAVGMVASSSVNALSLKGDPAVLGGLEGGIVFYTSKLFPTHTIDTERELSMHLSDLALPEGVTLSGNNAELITISFALMGE